MCTFSHLDGPYNRLVSRVPLVYLTSLFKSLVSFSFSLYPSLCLSVSLSLCLSVSLSLCLSVSLSLCLSVSLSLSLSVSLSLSLSLPLSTPLSLLDHVSLRFHGGLFARLRVAALGLGLVQARDVSERRIARVAI